MRTCAMAFALAIACGRAPARVGSGGPVDAGAEVFADGGVIGSSGTATLLVVTSGEGLVRAADGDCRGYCTVRGNNIHLTAVPDPGATFVGWSGACSGTGDCDWALVGTATSPPRSSSSLLLRNSSCRLPPEGRTNTWR